MEENYEQNEEENVIEPLKVEDHRDILKGRVEENLNIVFVDEIEDEKEKKFAKGLDYELLTVNCQVTLSQIRELKKYGINSDDEIKRAAYDELLKGLFDKIKDKLPEYDTKYNGKYFDNFSDYNMSIHKTISELHELSKKCGFKSFICSVGMAELIMNSDYFIPNSQKDLARLDSSIYYHGDLPGVRVYVDPFMNYNDSTIRYSIKDKKLYKIYVDSVSYSTYPPSSGNVRFCLRLSYAIA